MATAVKTPSTLRKPERVSTPSEDVKMPRAKTPGHLSQNRVILLGAGILLFATLGFYSISGMIDEKATGSHLVNAFYCAVMTLTT